jgi:hypothetical protein
MSTGRRAARRTALFLLYQWDVTGQPLASLHEGEVDEYARSLAESVAARAAELDTLITEAAEGWTANRLGAVERNVLRIAVHELQPATCRNRLRSTRPSGSPSATRATRRDASSTGSSVGSSETWADVTLPS